VATVISFQLLFTYAPFMQWLFHSRPLSATVWLVCIGVAVTIFLLVELEKSVIRNVAHNRRRSAADADANGRFS